jgi:hypothetical protein
MSSKGKNKKKSEEQPSSLDLGLSALLSGDSPSVDSARASSETAASPAGPEGVLPGEPPSTRTLSEFEELLQKKDWAALVKLAESKLVQDDDPEFRLWWVRGHLGALSMPVSFLAAPLEAVCRRARDHQLTEELRPVLQETGSLALARLKEVGARDQVESLEDSLFDAGVLDIGRGERPTPVKAEAVPQGHPGATAGASTSLGQASPTQREKLTRSSIRGSWLGLILGISTLLCVGLGGWYWFHAVLTVPVVIAEEDFISEQLTVNQLIPPLERRGAVGSLSALFYSIEHPEQSEATPQQPVPPTAQGDSQGDTAAKGEQGSPSQAESGATASSTLSRKPQPLPVPEKHKERINTRSPVEGADLKERLRKRETRASREGSQEPPVQGPEARVSPPLSENRNPDVFDPGGVYRVLVRTSVLANASYAAEVVGRLEPGDRVFVEAKMGRWMRLRSKRGRGGFVLAEDVEEVSPGGMGR